MKQARIKFIRKRNLVNRVMWHIIDEFPGAVRVGKPYTTFCGERFYSIVEAHIYVTSSLDFRPPHSGLYFCTRCLKANVKGQAVYALCRRWLKNNPDMIRTDTNLY